MCARTETTRDPRIRQPCACMGVGAYLRGLVPSGRGLREFYGRSSPRCTEIFNVDTTRVP